MITPTDRAERMDDVAPPQLAPTGRRTRAGSTPNTDRIRSGPRVAAGEPSATMRPSLMTATRGKKCAARARSWRTATTVVPSRSIEVHQQLHDVDLVADVEVRGRLVEDQDRRRLGDGDRDEHELALTHRQLAHVAMPEMGDAHPIHGRGDGEVIGRTQPGERRLVRKAAQGHDLVDRHLERQLDELGDHRDGARDRRAFDACRWGRRTGGPNPSLGRSTPVIARSRLDLPAPLGPTSATRSPPPISSVAAVTTRRSP